jgi:hypothetical protein
MIITKVKDTTAATITFISITIISISISIAISYLSTINSFFPIKNWFEKRANVVISFLLSFHSSLSNHNNSIASVISKKDDVQPIQIYKTPIIPKFEDYYDILSASVNYTNNKLLVFSMDLAGNPNNNKIYETAYIWLLYNNNNSGNNIPKVSSANHNNKEQIYTLIISNFGPDSKFKLKGWYMAVFNNTNNSYTLPLVKIPNMSDNNVKAYVPPYLLGNPSLVNYLASVLVRVNSTFLNKPPDYVMDSVPHDNKFWQEWFSQQSSQNKTKQINDLQ